MLLGNSPTAGDATSRRLARTEKRRNKRGRIYGTGYLATHVAPHRPRPAHDSPLLSSVCVYRGRCARERGAAFTPLPRGTVPVTLRIFQTAGNGRPVQRP